MKIFGTIYPFIETDEQSFKIGRHVANYEFFKSLITESNFDEFHIFCLSTNHFNITKNKLLQESIPDTQKQKIRLFLLNHLIDQISSTEYHTFHLGGWGYFFPGLVYLRNKYAKNKFPITGLIHSLNGIETNYHALKICTAPLLPYDTVICSSIAGKKVVEKIFKHIEKNFTSGNTTLSFKGNTKTIPLGINDSSLTTPDKKECRRHLSLPMDAIVLLTLGRLSPQTKSDLYPLIKTFQKLTQNASGKPLVLIIAGGANEKQIQIVKQMISECDLENSVHLITNFANDSKPYIYGAADIYLSLSDNLQETFGISVIEAMAAGLPVIASDINGYSELIDHNETGYKVPTLWTDQLSLAELADIMNFETMQLMLAQCMAVDTEELHKHLYELINNKDLCVSMGAKAKKVVEQNYRWATIIHHYEGLWDNLFEQSLSYSGEVQIKENPFLNDYLNTFNHYPTSTLKDDNMCTITQDGKEVIKTGKLPLPYTNIGSLLNNNAIVEVLKHLSQKPSKVSDIVSLDSLSIKNDILKYTLLWMAKYSLIHIT